MRHLTGKSGTWDYFLDPWVDAGRWVPRCHVVPITTAGWLRLNCAVCLCTLHYPGRAESTVHRAEDTSEGPGRDTHSTKGCGTIGYLERSVSAPSRTLSVNIGRILSGAFLMATWLSTQVDGKLRIKKAARPIRSSLQQSRSASPTTAPPSWSLGHAHSPRSAPSYRYVALDGLGWTEARELPRFAHHVGLVECRRIGRLSTVTMMAPASPSCLAALGASGSAASHVSRDWPRHHDRAVDDSLSQCKCPYTLQVAVSARCNGSIRIA